MLSTGGCHNDPFVRCTTRTPTALPALLLIAALAPAAGQSAPRPVVRAIEVRRVGVFDSLEASNWLFRLANIVHAETRESVIRSELLFQEGTPYDSATAAESARNLRALGLFRSVAIDTARTDSGLVVRVTTRDAWTTSLGVDVQRTGNQGSFSALFAETNFLGTGSHILANSSHFPDHDELAVEFSQPRLIGNRSASTFRMMKCSRAGSRSWAMSMTF